MRVFEHEVESVKYSYEPRNCRNKNKFVDAFKWTHIRYVVNFFKRFLLYIFFSTESFQAFGNDESGSYMHVFSICFHCGIQWMMRGTNTSGNEKNYLRDFLSWILLLFLRVSNRSRRIWWPICSNSRVQRTWKKTKFCSFHIF